MSRLILFYFPFYGLIIFFLSNIIAMYFYPGGSISNHESLGYDFFRNFLSQLGRVNSYLISSDGSQVSNILSFRIWSTGMAVTGLIFFIYYIYLPSFFNNKKIAIVGSFLATISCICFIFTGLTPGDVVIHLTDRNNNILNIIDMYKLHIFFANNIFYFAFPSALCYSYLIFYSKKINKLYGLGYYIFSFLIFIYIIILIYGPSPFESEIGLIIQATSQKIIAISWVLSTFILSIGMKKIYND